MAVASDDIEVPPSFPKNAVVNSRTAGKKRLSGVAQIILKTENFEISAEKERKFL